MSISGRQVLHYNIFDTQAGTGTSKTICVRDFRNCVVKIGTASNANMTVKCQGAIASAATDYTGPTFSSAQSVSNHWDYVMMADLQDGSSVTGNTGFIVTGTDDFKNYEINVNGLDFLAFTVTARSAGTVTIDCQLSTNS